MAISHCYWNLVVKNGNLTLLLTSSGQEWQFHMATDILVVKNGNFTLLLTSTVVKNGNLTLLLTSSGQDMAISHFDYWHCCGYRWQFHILLTSTGVRMAISKSRHQEWQFHIATNMQWSRMAVWLLDVCSSVKLPFWALDVSSNVKLPFLTTRCQQQCLITILEQ